MVDNDLQNWSAWRDKRDGRQLFFGEFFKFPNSGNQDDAATLFSLHPSTSAYRVITSRKTGDIYATVMIDNRSLQND